MRVDWSELILLADFQTRDDAKFLPTSEWHQQYRRSKLLLVSAINSHLSNSTNSPKRWPGHVLHGQELHQQYR
jgi:hypothetical protein